MKQFIYVFVVFVLHCRIGSIPPAYAEPIDLSVYPPITEIMATAGATLRAPLRITNHSPKKQHVTFAFIPIRSALEDGTVALSENDTPPLGLFSLEKDGKTLASEISLRPNETADFSLVVKTPINASDSGTLGGDYYVTLLFQTKNAEKLKFTGSKVEGGIGSNILLSVYEGAGEAAKKPVGRIKGFLPKQTFFIDGPRSFSLLVENLGPHFIKAGGQISITDINGREEEKIILSKQTILAHSSRNISGDFALSSKNLFGKYTANAAVTMSGDEVLFDAMTFYAIPKKATALLLGLLLVSFIVLARLTRYRKQLFVPSNQSKRRTKKV